MTEQTSNRSTVVSFDADAALAAVLDRVDGRLFTFVEYDADGFNPLYVDEATLALYGGEERMLAHFEEIHSYVHVDFMEVEMFTDTLFPVAERVEYITTAMDYMTLVRIYHEREGVFMALEPEESVQPLTAAVGEAIRESSE